MVKEYAAFFTQPSLPPPTDSSKEEIEKMEQEMIKAQKAKNEVLTKLMVHQKIVTRLRERKVPCWRRS